MRVFSYLELHTTLIAWQLFGVLYDVIASTGLILAPLVWSLYRITIQAIGEERGDGHETTVSNLKSVLQIAVVMLFCLVPAWSVTPSSISYEPRALTAGGPAPGEVTAETDTSTYRDAIPSTPIGGATQVPGWWALLHAISTGVTNAVIQSLPDHTDLREIKTQMTAMNIHDSALADQYGRFLNICYHPSKQNYHRLRQEGAIPAPDPEDALASVDWAGSHYLYDMAGGYQPCSGESNCRGAPHFLDPPLPALVGANTCAGWWDLLRDRIYQQASAGPYDIEEARRRNLDRGMAVFGDSAGRSDRDREDLMIRKTLENHEMRLTASPATQRDSSLLGTVVQGARNAATLAGSAAAWFTLEIMLGIVQQALPILIAIMLMFMIAMIPLALLFTGFRIEPVIRLSFMMFSAIFLHAVLAIADWLDYYLTVSLFDGQAYAWLAADDRAFGHAQKRMLINIVLLVNYIAAPMLWFSVMSAAGAAAGKAGGDLVSQSGGRDSGIAQQVAGGAGKNLTTPGGMASGAAKAGGAAARKFKY